jgi:hypothetical protein
MFLSSRSYAAALDEIQRRIHLVRAVDRQVDLV